MTSHFIEPRFPQTHSSLFLYTHRYGCSYGYLCLQIENNRAIAMLEASNYCRIAQRICKDLEIERCTDASCGERKRERERENAGECVSWQENLKKRKPKKRRTKRREREREREREGAMIITPTSAFPLFRSPNSSKIITTWSWVSFSFPYSSRPLVLTLPY